MRNIFETDGLSREKRLERASAPVVLPVLEERFPMLLSRALRRSDFASVYQFQSLMVLLEIELFDTEKAETDFLDHADEDKRVAAIHTLVMQLDSWCSRLEYACLAGGTHTLLKDLSGQITINMSPMYTVFYRKYREYLSKRPSSRWFSGKRKNKEEYEWEDFPRRFYLLLLASIRLIQSQKENYREEIYSAGNMDPSLALLVAFLHNYRDIAVAFNARWQSLPMFYLNDILRMCGRKQSAGTTWMAFEIAQAGAGTLLHKDSYWAAGKDDAVTGYELLSDLRLSRMKLAGMNMIHVEKNKERYPEAALGYVTAVTQAALPQAVYSPVPIGFCLHSSMFALGEGKREVNILFRFTAESLKTMKEAIEQVASVQEISRDEAWYKVLHDAFLLWISTAEEMQPVENFHLRMEEGEGLLLTFRLNDDFPPVTPMENDDLPSVRMLVNSSAWLFPYSWARKMSVKSIKISVAVQGMRNIQFYNDLGQVDVRQAFYPFGLTAEKGAWLAFGCYEMACKPVQTVELSFHWQHLPTCNGGLEEYYRNYGKEIDNRSFRGRIDRLCNRNWKPLPEAEPVYLFRTSRQPVPARNDLLAEYSDIKFSLSDSVVLPYHPSASFELGEAHSGFYRLVLTEPDMGFGGSEYRRLFADVMMYNSHARRKKPLPEIPLSLLMDAPSLSYTAEEDCYFSVGSVTGNRFSYICPLSEEISTVPDTSHPVALIDGPADEGNLMIGIREAVGENLIAMYFELELMQREIDHAFLPRTDWYYRDTLRWVRVDSVHIVRDDTCGLMHSGAVILQFPFCITSEMTDANGVFWLCMAVHSCLCNTSAVRNIHLNVVEAKAVVTEGVRVSVPGLISYNRVAPLAGERREEKESEMLTRMSERIAGRNRLLLPSEYERWILREFPEIVKVKCFPCMDEKRLNRNAVVTLAVIPADGDKDYPLCTDELLCRIEDHCRLFASPFADIDLINPVYEEVTVFCGISLKTGEAAGTAIQNIYEVIHACIAPWNKEEGIPVFGYSFTMRDLQSRIKEEGHAACIHGMKLLHVVRGTGGEYILREYLTGAGEEQVISPSLPWAILVPASRHYVNVVSEEEWRRSIEYGDLEIENTFVIK